MNKVITVGIADMKYTRNEGILITYALGSCVGVCLYDPVVKVAAMIHVMLPMKLEGSKDSNIYKFANTGILETLKKMQVFGAVKSRITAKIAGGAKMFDVPDGLSFGNIGLRNVESVKQVLKSQNISIIGENVGGNYARTLLFDSSNGLGVLRTYGKKEITF